MEELRIEYLPVDALAPYDRNARRHQDEDVAGIMASIKEFGMNDPIGIWSDHNVIVEGHGRLMACKKLGIETVPVIRLDHLSDEQRRAYALAHNKTAELSEWDFDMLNSELEELSEFDFDLETMGFDLGNDEDDDYSEIVEDEYDAEPPAEPIAKRGDIWQLGRHRLMCGNSLVQQDIEKLLDGNYCELTFTDPPYELSTQGGGLYFCNLSSFSIEYRWSEQRETTLNTSVV